MAGGVAALPATGAIADSGGAGNRTPAVHPQPTGMERTDRHLALPRRVSVVVGEDTDARAGSALRGVLEDVGCQTTMVTATDAQSTPPGARIHLGTTRDNPTITPALELIGAQGPDELAADGYVLAGGRADGSVAVLAGRDARGTYYAVQTLRQLLDGAATIPNVQVRDEPLMEIRGAIEGFYGIPWSHRSRLDHFAFYGEHKLNTYIYTPKDDLLLRAKWRDLYEGEELEKLGELVEEATAHHVTFTYALSPGNDITYGSDADFEATVAKFDQLRDLGVTSFYIALDDIPTDMVDEDAAQFDSLADAQVHYLNRIQTEYVSEHDLEPLQTVPTEYFGSGTSDYKSTFGRGVDPDIRIQWTGEGVFSPTVTEESVAKAVETYHSEHLFIWDNFPVNDGRRDRLFLNPLEGRAPTLHEHLAGFTANPLIQPYASLISLANYADYCWNPPAYEADASWDAALDELAGSEQHARDALRVFTDLNQHWPYRDGSPHAPQLTADVEEYWASRESGGAEGTALVERLEAIADLESSLASMASTGFYEDTLPWIVATGHWANGLLSQHEMLAALAEDRTEDASSHAARAAQEFTSAGEATVPDQREDGVYREDQIVPSVGDGVFEDFADRAWELLREVLPEDPSLPFRGLPATASTTLGTYQDYTVDAMVDGDPSTMFWSDDAPEVDDEVRVELEESHPIAFARVQMAENDETAGDQIYAGVLELSADGTSWTQIAETDGKPLLDVTLTEPIEARYGRLRVTGSNPGAQWVQIREFGLSETVPSS